MSVYSCIHDGWRAGVITMSLPRVTGVQRSGRTAARGEGEERESEEAEGKQSVVTQRRDETAPGWRRRLRGESGHRLIPPRLERLSSCGSRNLGVCPGVSRAGVCFGIASVLVGRHIT